MTKTPTIDSVRRSLSLVWMWCIDRLTGIRRAILEGDIDRALKHTNAFYPQVLQDNEEVHFKLRCRKFIEMVRRAAQLRSGGSETKKSNGHDSESFAPSQDMEVDANGDSNMLWPDSATMDDGSSDPQTDLLKLEQEMLHYGQTLGAEYANDQRKEISKALGEIWSLVAYANPHKEPQVSHLLDRKGRVAVAEELNSTILGMFSVSFSFPRANLSSHSLSWQVVTRGARKGVCANDGIARGLADRRRVRGVCISAGRGEQHYEAAAGIARASYGRGILSSKWQHTFFRRCWRRSLGLLSRIVSVSRRRSLGSGRPYRA